MARVLLPLDTGRNSSSGSRSGIEKEVETLPADLKINRSKSTPTNLIDAFLQLLVLYR
jgi:hypothetical protein